MDTVKEAVMEARLAQGETLKELLYSEIEGGMGAVAARIGSSRQLVNACINGVNRGERAREALADALGVSSEWFDRHLDAYLLRRFGTEAPYRMGERKKAAAIRKREKTNGARFRERAGVQKSKARLARIAKARAVLVKEGAA